MLSEKEASWSGVGRSQSPGIGMNSASSSSCWPIWAVKGNLHTFHVIRTKGFLFHRVMTTDLSQPEGTGAVPSLVCSRHHRGLQEALLPVVLQRSPKTPVATLRLWGGFYVHFHKRGRSLLAQSCTQAPSAIKLQVHFWGTQTDPKVLTAADWQSTTVGPNSLGVENLFWGEKEKIIQTADCTGRGICLSLLTHYDNCVPAPARKIRHMMEGAKNGPWHGTAYLWTKAFVCRHPKASVSSVSPGKNLIVCDYKTQLLFVKKVLFHNSHLITDSQREAVLMLMLAC